MIPYGKQYIDSADTEAVAEVLASEWLTQGPKVREFERALEHYCGAKHVVCVANGAAALHVSCMALGLSSTDWLWTSPNSFVASANCARYCGAKVDFVDIDPSTRNICPVKLEQKLALAERDGVLPKIVVAVHFAGLPCDMSSIRQLSKRYGFTVIEDAAHAIGGHYLGNKIGSCQFSDACVFSFHPVKNMTSAEGGAIATNSDEICLRLRLLSTQGLERDEKNFVSSGTPSWRYEQQLLGFNYRLSDVHAALGLSQLAKLDGFVSVREKHVVRYQQLLNSVPSISSQVHQAGVAWHLFVIEVESTKRDHLFTKLRNHGVWVNLHYFPIHLQPYYRDLGFREGDFPVAELYSKRAISLPLYVGLSETDQDRVITLMGEALK